jgi:hypothetical protein
MGVLLEQCIVISKLFSQSISALCGYLQEVAICTPAFLDLSQELSQSSQELSQSYVYFNGMQGCRQPSEGFSDVSTYSTTTSPLFFCLDYDVELPEPSFLNYPQTIIIVCAKNYISF